MNEYTYMQPTKSDMAVELVSFSYMWFFGFFEVGSVKVEALDKQT